MLFEWEATRQTRSTHGSQGNPTRPINWTKPFKGRMKCKIDAFF